MEIINSIYTKWGNASCDIEYIDKLFMVIEYISSYCTYLSLLSYIVKKTINFIYSFINIFPKFAYIINNVYSYCYF